MIALDTDVISRVMRGRPGSLVDRLAGIPPSEQSTTAITMGEIAYGPPRSGVRSSTTGPWRCVTGNVRHFRRVPGLVVEDWLSD